ncbi:serine/threonine protein kinase, partial [Streptomyces sp. MUM 203J]|uniref:serine/threonine-protein kinase n=1 Tax=Streptomyces sp. MUM 203J TaxID=2791990 RepID=UPI001F042316
MVQEDLLADRYSLMEPLGSGGSGQVWRAWDSALGRQVALKVLAAPPGDPDAARRAWDEAHTVAGLSHAGIAALYDLGHAADGRPFMVMELVEGWSLAELIRTQGVLGWERVADLGAQVARALAAAHGRGVVHRDVKPANLLVTEDGTVKVVDFGIAVLAGRDAGQPSGPPDTPPAAWAPLGTAAYTAPEVALRHPVGPSADLYGLGCTLYEALVGRPPFPGADAAEVLYRHVHEQPAHLGEMRPDAPRQLTRTVHALLAKNPADRPALCGLAAARQALLAGLVEPSARTG